LQKTIIGWPAVVQYFIDVYCREARRFYEIESEGFLNDASCYILKEWFFEPCPAGTHADSTKYRTERRLPDARCYILNEWFYELCPAGTYADIYETENEGFLMSVVIFLTSGFMSCVLQGHTLICTKQRTKGS
jgi:hypothetical protein